MVIRLITRQRGPPVRPARSKRSNPPARPNAAEGLGTASPATKRAAETICEEARLARIQWDTRETVGVLELAEAELGAATGVRPSGILMLRGMGEAASGFA